MSAVITGLTDRLALWLAKVISAFGLMAVWLAMGREYSIGSSIVMMFRPLPANSLIDAYKVVVLPLPVGPHDRIMPCGRVTYRRSRPRYFSDMPS